MPRETAKKTPSNGITAINPAVPNYTPTGPHPKRAAELGLVIGILLSFGALMLLDSLDRRLRSPDDLEEFTNLPLLAAIAPSAFAGELETPPVDEEAFQTLRTSLTYFTVDKKIRSVLVDESGRTGGQEHGGCAPCAHMARAGLDVCWWTQTCAAAVPQRSLGSSRSSALDWCSLKSARSRRAWSTGRSAGRHRPAASTSCRSAPAEPGGIDQLRRDAAI